MPKIKRPLKVFLCHASKDKPIVRELYQRLDIEDWIDVWLDEKNLLPGQTWQLSIEEAVESADLVIICLSRNSVSREGYIQRELKYAEEVALEKPEGTVFLIPLRLDSCKVPKSLHTYQWGDYFGEKKEETYLALLKSLKLRHKQKVRLEKSQIAVSVVVDKWFVENTFQADDFKQLDEMVEQKREQGVTISLALPALNEEETVGKVIKVVKNELMDKHPLLDEIVLVDSNSTDRTRQIAHDLGVPVYIHQHLLPDLGPRYGKGEAIWKSLLATRGDIIVWIDTDIVNIHPRFVYGLIGPLLYHPEINFVKGFYRRPLKVGTKIQVGGGGRVTELTVRPLLNLFYPELSGLVQPLSGEFSGRRNALEQLPFFSGYGVEVGLIIEMFERFGVSAISQVDLLERIHHNQSLEALSKMSFSIIQAVIKKLEKHNEQDLMEDVNRTMKLIRYEKGGYYLDFEEIAEEERPPIIELMEYRSLREDKKID